MTRFALHAGDCLHVMRELDADSFDSVITDPPYGLSFMGKDWDHGVPGEAFWREALRVAKPGAHLLAFGGTRTFHRLAVAIEDAGWEIRDTVMWVYGSGFPKSLDVSKAIDKAAGAEREVVGKSNRHGGGARVFENQGGTGFKTNGKPDVTAPATDAAKQWDGWGTALKPAFEPVIVARKPLMGTVAQNVLKYGTGAMNIDASRVGSEPITINTWDDGAKPFGGGAGHEYTGRTSVGRWPANLIHDGSEEVIRLFPSAPGGAYPKNRAGNSVYGEMSGGAERVGPMGDAGSAARFFYCAKASKADRDEGCEGMEAKGRYKRGGVGGTGGKRSVEAAVNAKPSRNHHPTVKPTDLMRYLCRLVTPPGGLVLDPFMGSGSTGKAAILEGFNFVGIDLQPEYVAIAEARINHAKGTKND